MRVTRALHLLVFCCLTGACGDDDVQEDPAPDAGDANIKDGQSSDGQTKAGSGGSRSSGTGNAADSGAASAGKGGSGGKASAAGKGGSAASAGKGGSSGTAGRGGSAAPSDDEADGGTPPATDPGTETPAREVPCTDQSFQELVLYGEPSQREVRDESSENGVFQSYIDAQGGGLSPTESFVYVRFTDEGLQRVDISDEAAFSSLDWHMAVRRYFIRLNSGVSGPGEITGAVTTGMPTFDSVSSVPDGLEYRSEAYFTESCELVTDSSLMSGATVLTSFASYTGCVTMSHNVFVVALDTPSPRHVKLEVLSYYTPENQQMCDETMAVPMPTGAGNIRIKWAFLD
jgi:hypothetical protein